VGIVEGPQGSEEEPPARSNASWTPGARWTPDITRVPIGQPPHGQAALAVPFGRTIVATADATSTRHGRGGVWGTGVSGAVFVTPAPGGVSAEQSACGFMATPTAKKGRGRDPKNPKEFRTPARTQKKNAAGKAGPIRFPAVSGEAHGYLSITARAHRRGRCCDLRLNPGGGPAWGLLACPSWWLSPLVADRRGHRPGFVPWVFPGGRLPWDASSRPRGLALLVGGLGLRAPVGRFLRSGPSSPEGLSAGLLLPT